jgi:adenylate kinase family enzyme
VRVAVLGNSGSGKSTLARWLAERSGAAMLDLDTIAWVPGQIAAERATTEAKALVRAFCEASEDWIVEGCYAQLTQAALDHRPLLLFMNPGLAQCLENCRSRPWEPHKYASKKEQDERLDFLLTWVADYYTRSGDLSYAEHRACFESYSGPKREIRGTPQLDPPSDEVLACVA